MNLKSTVPKWSSSFELLLLISYSMVPSLFETTIRKSGLSLKLLSLLTISKLKIYPGTSIFCSICLNDKTVVHSLQFLAIKPGWLSPFTLTLQIGSGKLINLSLTWIMWSSVPFMKVFADKITGGPKMTTWNIQISPKKIKLQIDICLHGHIKSTWKNETNIVGFFVQARLYKHFI